uniref:Uncharacterized protein n=1 Tax=Rhizophora mucronata TaxID=61149 RepID=A0A2P2Q4U0_RHIMU
MVNTGPIISKILPFFNCSVHVLLMYVDTD